MGEKQEGNYRGALSDCMTKTRTLLFDCLINFPHPKHILDISFLAFFPSDPLIHSANLNVSFVCSG